MEGIYNVKFVNGDSSDYAIEFNFHSELNGEQDCYAVIFNNNLKLWAVYKKDKNKVFNTAEIFNIGASLQKIINEKS